MAINPLDYLDQVLRQFQGPLRVPTGGYSIDPLMEAMALMSGAPMGQALPPGLLPWDSTPPGRGYLPPNPVSPLRQVNSSPRGGGNLPPGVVPPPNPALRRVDSSRPGQGNLPPASVMPKAKPKALPKLPSVNSHGPGSGAPPTARITPKPLPKLRPISPPGPKNLPPTMVNSSGPGRGNLPPMGPAPNWQNPKPYNSAKKKKPLY